ncbi:hypothetical protein HN51_034041 [Arachis hypogaea]
MALLFLSPLTQTQSHSLSSITAVHLIHHCYSPPSPCLHHRHLSLQSLRPRLLLRLHCCVVVSSLRTVVVSNIGTAVISVRCLHHRHSLRLCSSSQLAVVSSSFCSYFFLLVLLQCISVSAQLGF